MRSTRAGAGAAGESRGPDPADLLATAASLRWVRPDLTAALADHVLDVAAVAGDLDCWLLAAGWVVHARAATGDGREEACEVLAALPGWGATRLTGPPARRLRVELGLVAVRAGEVDTARALLEPVADGDAEPELRADALGALARCAVEDAPRRVVAALRGAESAWSEVGGAIGDIGAASVALVAATAHHRAGRADAAVDAAASGLAQLERGRVTGTSGTPSGFLTAALAAEWITALLDAGRPDEAREGCMPLEPRLTEPTRPSRQLAGLRLAVARVVADREQAAGTAEALEQAAEDAADSDAPDLESVCRSALGALHERAGRREAAMEAARLGVVAHRRDRSRAARFAAALAVVTPASSGGRSSSSMAGGWEAVAADSGAYRIRGAEHASDGRVGSGSWRSGRERVDTPFDPLRDREWPEAGGHDDELEGWPASSEGVSSGSPIGDLVARTLRPDGSGAGRIPEPTPLSDPSGWGERIAYGSGDEPGRRSELDDPWAREFPPASDPRGATEDRGPRGDFSDGIPDAAGPGDVATDDATRDDMDTWLRSALADLDRIWARTPVETGAPRPTTASEIGVCIVAIDLVREGRRIGGRTSAVILRAVADRLTERLPSGGRLRHDEADALSVVLPGWGSSQATGWMHQALPGLLHDLPVEDDLPGVQLRSAVRDADGPVGAPILQRLDRGPRAADAQGTRGRPGRPDQAWGDRDEPVRTATPRPNGAAVHREPGGEPDRTSSPPHAPGRFPQDARGRPLRPSPSPGAGYGAEREPREAQGPAGGVTARREYGAAVRRPAGDGAGPVPRRVAEGGNSPYRAGEPDRSTPAPNPTARAAGNARSTGRTGDVDGPRSTSRHDAANRVPFRADGTDVTTGSRRHRRDAESEQEQQRTPSGRSQTSASTEGLGIADLLAGALAAYRGI